MTSPSFAVVGDNCIDRFLPPVGDSLVGGNAVNVAVQLARLGCSVDYFGAVGDDPAGEAIAHALRANGVGTGWLKRIAGETTARTDIETLPGGDRRFVFESFGACLAYRPGPAEIARLRHMSHVHVGWLCEAVVLRQALAGSGVVLSQDLSVNNRAEDLDPSGLDIAFTSSTPESGDAESHRLLQAGAKLAVVTLGAAGSLVNELGKIRTAPAAAVPVTDTTGAGDAFIAGFLEAHAKHLTLQDCLHEGNRLGGRACGHRGGFPQVPLKPFVHDVKLWRERVLDCD